MLYICDLDAVSCYVTGCSLVYCCPL